MWGTETLFKDQSRISTMVNVRLPTKSKEIADSISNKLLFDYSTYVPVYNLFEDSAEKEAVYYVRVSCAVYNDISDYEYLGKSILDIINNS